MFDQLGGLERLVRAKTVTIKVNMTGSPGMRVRGKAPALDVYKRQPMNCRFAA